MSVYENRHMVGDKKSRKKRVLVICKMLTSNTLQ